MQAQSIGFYPPSSNNAILDDFQQENAVPPLKGVNFTAEQKELGAPALKDAFTPFPIFSNYIGQDFHLHLRADNCRLYK